MHLKQLRPVVTMPDKVRGVCREWQLDRLLAELALLVPGEDSAMRHRLDEWLGRRRIRVNIAGEFDDAALLAAFGGEGVGVFPVASVLAYHHLASGELVALGEAEQVRIEYYALTAQRRVTHP